MSYDHLSTKYDNIAKKIDLLMRKRKRQRLKGYEYAQNGAYFITVCVRNVGNGFKPFLELGNITNGTVTLNDLGQIVQTCWSDLPNHYLNIILDTFIIMPDHVHGILFIENDNACARNGFKPFPTKTHGLSEIMRGFKTFSSRRINEFTNKSPEFHWQKSYYDRIIRNDKELHDIRQYIENNPLKWDIE